MTLIWLACLATADASTFRDIPTLATLTDEAESIVEGEVILARTSPCSLGLCTTHTILVQQVLKGDPAETLEITLPGGRYQGLVQRAAGIPLWSEGDHVLVFVHADGEARLHGLMTVTDDGRTLDPLQRLPHRSTVEELAAFVRDRHPRHHD